MDAGLSSIDRDFFTCNLCLEYFKNPRSLPCLHSYCCECLRKYLVSQDAEELRSRSKFPCPLCMREVAPADLSRPVHEWADAFPHNFTIASLMERMGVAAEAVCDLCARKGVWRDAASWCRRCRRRLCRDCAELHERIGLTRNHELLDVQLVEQHQVQTLTRGIPCMTHHNETVRLFCSSCHDFVCHECMLGEHARCRNVVPLVRALEEKRDSFRSLLLASFRQKAAVSSIRDRTERCRAAFTESKAAAVEEAKLLSEKMCSMIREKEEDVLEEIERRHDLKQRSLDLKIRQCDDLEKSMVATCDVFLEAFRYDDVFELLSIYKSVEEEIEKCSGIINLLKVDNVELKIKFETDYELKDSLLHSKYPLGRLILEENQAVQELEEDSSLCLQDILKPRFNTGENRPVLKSQFSPHISGEVYHSPTGVVVLKSGDIVITDFCNNMIKKYMATGILMEQVPIKNPLDIACMSETQVSVTLPYQKRIVFFKCDNALELSHSIQNEKPYDGIAAIFETQELVCACSTPPSVDILTYDGAVKQSVTRNSFGYEIFVTPFFVSTCPLGNILVTDYKKKCLFCCSSRGDVLFSFRGVEGAMLEDPRGVCTDSQGRIYLADQKSNRIYRLTAKGRLEGVLLDPSDKIVKPLAMCLSQTNDLVFTEVSGNIKVYQI